MQETGVRSLGQGDPLEKEMASYSSILTWKIPQRNLAGASSGLPRVGHDLATKTKALPWTNYLSPLSFVYVKQKPLNSIYPKLLRLKYIMYINTSVCLEHNSTFKLLIFTVCFLFNLLATPQGMWDFSSLSRHQTHAQYWQHGLNHWTTGKSKLLNF